MTRRRKEPGSRKPLRRGPWLRHASAGRSPGSGGTVVPPPACVGGASALRRRAVRVPSDIRRETTLHRSISGFFALGRPPVRGTSPAQVTSWSSWSSAGMRRRSCSRSEQRLPGSPRHLDVEPPPRPPPDGGHGQNCSSTGEASASGAASRERRTQVVCLCGVRAVGRSRVTPPKRKRPRISPGPLVRVHSAGFEPATF